MGFTLSADGKRLFSVHSGNQTGEGKILEWDVDDGKLSRTWADPSDRGSGYHTTVSPDGKTLVYSDADFRDFKQGLARLSLWRLDQLDRQKTPDKLLVNGDYASCIEFTQDSSRIVSVHKDQLIVWNREKQQAERIVQLAQQRTLFRLLTLRSDGKVLAVASSDGLIRVVDRETGKVLHDFLGHEGWIDGLALSPDGRWLVSSSPEAPIFVWKLK
jgi:WD40 repeat protein